LPSNKENLQNQLQDYLERLFPLRKELQITKLEKINVGWETEKYSIEISYNEAGEQKQEDLFFRIFMDQQDAEQATREFRIMKKLSEMGFSVPPVFDLKLDDKPLGTPFILMRGIRGQPMTALWMEASEEEKIALLRQFIGTWAELHSLDWKEFIRDPSKISSFANQEFLTFYLAEWEERLNRYRIPILLPILEWLKEQSSNVASKGLSLIHGDYHPENFLISETGEFFVIDWAAVDIADFRADLGWTLLLTTTYGYPLRPLILDEYERQSGEKIEQIEYFEVFAILKRLFEFIVTVTPTPGTEARVMPPETAELMKKDLFHYQNVYSLLTERTGLTIPGIETMLASLS
jgi:aminoglycoside phosphotransferase (APT) family kinase protein